MSKIHLLVISLLLALSGCSGDENKQEASKMSANASPPVAKKVPHEMTIHGHSRVDDYYWMRDDERKDTEVINHLNAENAYKETKLAHTKDFQEKLFQEITARIKKDDNSVPYLLRGYYYYRKFEGDKEYAYYARRKGSMEAPEETIIDSNKLAEGHDYFSLGDYSISTNNNLMAYSTDTLSRRVYTIEFKDLMSGQNLSDKLVETTGQIIWANDNQTVFYIRKDLQTLLGYKVYRHKLGTAQDDDVLVYEEKDKSFYTYLGKTKDDSNIAIFHSHTSKTGAHIIDANKPDGDFELFHAIEDDMEYNFAKLKDTYYIYTNWQAKNFRLMKVDAAHRADKSKWVDVIPHRPDVYLSDFELFNNHLVLREKVKGQIGIRVISLKDDKTFDLKFDDPAFTASFSINPEMESPKLRLRYSSLTTPNTIYDYDMRDGSREMLKQDEVVGNFDPANYASERLFVPARDGKQVPVSLVYRKDMFKKDGTNPLYQYAYGSYGYTREASFSSVRLSMLDRGFVYAIAHIRGGQMLGREWYEDGKLFNKINSFTDYIDVTKALVEQKYAAADKVFGVGGSAGGLLMGAVVNMAPELYRGIAAHVAFVDVVTTMLDTSIPLTTNEYDEWGNPNEKASYDYMLSYSPYDQVKKQAYPNMLVTTGLHDSQVQYFEPAKWVAKLRDYKTDDNLLVFDIDMEAGHGGASGRFKRYRDSALEAAFFFDLIGITE